MSPATESDRSKVTGSMADRERKNAPIVVIDYAMGNIHSMIKALRLYYPHVVFSGDPEVIRSARALVLPGDGAFVEAMNHLSGATGHAMLERVREGTPLLGVCIGFQVLFTNSSETDGASHKDQTQTVPGLNLIQGHVRRFRSSQRWRIPHMGWNRLVSSHTENYYNEYMYFIHSYRVQDVDEGAVLAYCQYGEDRFPAAIKKDNILATQFHPEKSDRHGLALIESWVQSLE